MAWRVELSDISQEGKTYKLNFNSSLEREAALSEQAATPKHGKGRPKGSKNKKTLEREAMEEALGKPQKRGPGRPKGSKNKKTLEREAAKATHQSG